MKPFRLISVPNHAHPMVRFLFTEMRAQRCSVIEMAERSGVNLNTIKNWRHVSMPKLLDLEACLNVLGHQLTIIEKPSERALRLAVRAGKKENLHAD
ncbi:MAG: hypothetical protein KDJ36_02745 [Hyphomicrobiaceae bacterium]|nr:hypothetical protein [Hyphomicrobiaceae bacterium]